MEPELENPPGEPAENENNVAETRAAIRRIVREAGGTPEQADELIDADATLEEARSAAFDLLVTRTQRGPRVRVVADHTDPNAIMERRVEALHARVTGATPKPEAREFMGVRLIDHARAMLAERGFTTLGLAPIDLIQRAHTISDFPNLLTGTGNRVLLSAFQAAQSPLLRLGRQATAPDFRPLNRLRISEIGAMKPLSESGELQNVSRAELADAYSIDSAGLIFSLTFRAIVNDDLGAFRDFAGAAGQQAAQYQKGVILNLIESNPTIEGAALFSDAHGNIAHQSGAGFFNVDATDEGQSALGPLDEMRRAMRTQKSLDGVTTLNLRPKFLLVGADLETDAQMALARINPVTSADVNPFEGSLELLVESDLAAESWYAFTAVEAAPVFEHAWLEGYTGPQLAQQENFRTLSTDFRAVIHWGAGLLPGGWRGAFANFGSVSSNS